MSQSTGSKLLKAGPGVEVLRSQLGRARGLGAARSGTAHWWAERVTSLALVPLTLWFVAFALGLSGAPRAAVAHAIANPVTATLLLATVLIMLHHMQLGLQVVIEDYARASARLAMVLAVKAVTVLLALLSALSILKLALIG